MELPGLTQQPRPSMERDPCPDRIIDDAGGGFGMGALGGSAFYFAKGFRNSPNGARIVGGMQAVRMNAPRIAGSWGVWCTLFSTCDCAMAFARQKEDPYNSIMAGAATSGMLAARQGLRAVLSASVQGGVLLAFVCGVGIMLSKLPVPDTGSMPVDDPFIPHVEESHVGGLFGGLFQKKDGRKSHNISNNTETLESLDMPSPPTPSFEYK